MGRDVVLVTGGNSGIGFECARQLARQGRHVLIFSSFGKSLQFSGIICGGQAMIISHNGNTPVVHPTAWIAPDATVCGDVSIGAHTRVLFGAKLIAEGGRIEIGEHCIVLENAVVRSTARHSTHIGDHCLIGPNAHVVGCTVEDEVFIATGAAIFHGARLGKGSEVRINGVVHLKSQLPAGATVPIGWVAVGDPIAILPPDQPDAIWARQMPLNFPLEVYGFDRSEANMVKITTRLSEAFASHEKDELVD